ncbi:hypothetical protein [Desulfovibrio intestinalis]|uniref:Uncharacterized protein n=1 Tax=Desulfovibrio intestinalis TaxID=58621 RepID=A0A7W8BZV3_9BACT|nr:hypothetical protein [Desulfovibrio intestinalis]MBB5142303.1 hypothetical protein [Desulfovibrio intestinalis]
MGYAKFLLGKQICEKLNIPLLRLAELCHAGKLAAYHFDDGRQILASSQCNTRFKYPDNTIFTIIPSNANAIIAISTKAAEDFSVYVDRKVNSPVEQDIDLHSGNDSKGKYLYNVLIAMDEQRLKNIKGMRMKFDDGEYIVYCNDLRNSPFQPDVIHVYKNEKIFFELNKQECEIALEYLELTLHNNCNVLNKEYCGGIKRCITNLCIKKEQDSFGSIKYILYEYNIDIIQIVFEKNVLNRECKKFINVDKNCKYTYAHQYQYTSDYFNKEDLSYSNPLSHEEDFFIFNFDEYKKRFHFFDDEEKSRKEFFNYIEKLMFDENEIRNVLEYEIEKKFISDDPKQYMLDRCKRLQEIYINDEDNLKVIKAYMLAIEGLRWAEIDQEVWKHSKDEDNSRTFVSRKLKRFRKISEDNKIPFIAAKLWKDNKESIVKNMLEQLATFYAGE